MEQLVIDRTQWLRGGEDAWLRDVVSKKMCCLGFEAIRRGFAVEEIEGVASPSQTSGAFSWGKLLDIHGNDSTLCINLMDVNDAITFEVDGEDLEDDAVIAKIREKKITALFASIGIAVTFIN